VREAKESADALLKTSLRDNLLIVSQFLRLAAARRVENAESSEDENQALEGVLLAVYSGDEGAVSTMTKLVEGVEEQTLSTAGEQLQSTCEGKRSSDLCIANTLRRTHQSPLTSIQVTI
jgi:hypothetical protein